MSKPVKALKQFFAELESTFSHSLFPGATVLLAVALIAAGATDPSAAANFQAKQVALTQEQIQVPVAAGGASQVSNSFLNKFKLPSAFKAGLKYKASLDVLSDIPALDPNLYSLDQPDSPWVVVNKGRPLNPLNYIPPHLVTPKFKGGSGLANGQKLDQRAADAMVLMAKAMKKAGAGKLVISSGYRSYATQVAVHGQDVASLGLLKGERLAARPGYSEHQTGLAADLSAAGQGCNIQVCFESTPAGRWLKYNSWVYGFVLRYPKSYTSMSGYQFEPWHFRYVGPELAAAMHRAGEPLLETFWGLPYTPNY